MHTNAKQAVEERPLTAKKCLPTRLLWGVNPKYFQTSSKWFCIRYDDGDTFHSKGLFPFRSAAIRISLSLAQMRFI